MAQLFTVHPENPQARLLKQAADLLRRGDVLAVPTDSSYALVCQLDDRAAADRLRHIRRLEDKQLLSLLCRDLSELASYARVDNAQYRLLKLGTPGPFTFILEASKEVPRRVSHPQRKTIGLRVPEHRALQGLIELHGAPLLATTLILPDDEDPLNEPATIRQRLEQPERTNAVRTAALLEPGDELALQQGRVGETRQDDDKEQQRKDDRVDDAAAAPVGTVTLDDHRLVNATGVE